MLEWQREHLIPWHNSWEIPALENIIFIAIDVVVAIWVLWGLLIILSPILVPLFEFLADMLELRGKPTIPVAMPISDFDDIDKRFKAAKEELDEIEAYGMNRRFNKKLGK